MHPNLRSVLLPLSAAIVAVARRFRLPSMPAYLVIGIARGQKVRANGIAFNTETVAIHRHLLGDPNRLQQVLLNYAANATKFTEDGT